MIIVSLTGGLGNQLFQYALGRRLAIKNNVPLKLDIAGFETYKLHKYALFNYNIVEEFATPEEVARLKQSHEWEDPNLPYYRRSVVKEAAFPYAPEIMEAPADVYLDGYWQTEKYFSSIACVLREDFTVKAELNADDLAVARLMEASDAISLHIRRGDYVSNAQTNQTHGTCPLDYYHRAAKLLAEPVANPHFFIFSDDPDWVEKSLCLGYPTTYIKHNGPDRNYADLWLMSRCQHNIVANSSFSWWGAWLNANPAKQVIVPDQWFADTRLDTRDLIPDAWRKLPKFEPPTSSEQAGTLETSAYLFALAGRGALGIVELVHAVETFNAADQGHCAIALYRLWLENTLSPLSYAIYFNLGVALESSADSAGAERAYRDALARKPDFGQARMNLAAMLRRQGRDAEAEEYER